MNSSTAATLPLAHTSSKKRRTRASFSCADTACPPRLAAFPQRASTPFLSEHDATWRDALHRLEAYSLSCLEEKFSAPLCQAALREGVCESATRLLKTASETRLLRHRSASLRDLPSAIFLR